MFFIRRDDVFGLYDSAGSFKEDRFKILADTRGWSTSWPRTATGKLELTGRVLGRQAKQYPGLRPLQHLHDQIAELRLGRFLNTVGADGYSRCPIMPFWTRSGRNQPRGRDKVFLLSLPSCRIVAQARRYSDFLCLPVEKGPSPNQAAARSVHAAIDRGFSGR
jgi:hypothetical protein